MTDTREDLSWPEWVILGFLTGFVLVASWIITLACYLASPSPWVKADRVVGTALVRGWTRLTDLADRALESRTATVIGTALIAVCLLGTIAITLILTDRDAAAWFWEKAFSQSWWPMPK